jgi:Na+-transporting methylmalonyl-CoA/oxaloacetate decarboxylase gamma subunit
MGFSMHHIGFANLFENGHNYITFSIMGMLIVFAGLSFISIYIIILSKILNLPGKLTSTGKKKKETDEAEIPETSESELLLAIAVALHLDQTRGLNYEKITWQRYEERESAWLTAGRMRGLAIRSHLPDRRTPGA